LSKSIAIEPGLLELLQKVAGVRFFWDTVYIYCPPQRRLADSCSEEGRRGCRNASNKLDEGCNLVHLHDLSPTINSFISCLHTSLFLLTVSSKK